MNKEIKIISVILLVVFVGIVFSLIFISTTSQEKMESVNFYISDNENGLLTEYEPIEFFCQNESYGLLTKVGAEDDKT